MVTNTYDVFAGWILSISESILIGTHITKYGAMFVIRSFLWKNMKTWFENDF